MDRALLQAIFDRVDTQRQRVVSRRELIAALAEDENLYRLLDVPPENVGQEVRRGFASAFALGDDKQDRFVTFEEFAAYLELSFKIASRTHDDPPPPLQPERKPQPEPEPQQGLAQHLTELEGRAAAAEQTQRKTGSPGSNDLSREELEVQQQIAALEREHLEPSAGSTTREDSGEPHSDDHPTASNIAAAAVAGKSQAELFMEQRRTERMQMLAEYGDGSDIDYAVGPQAVLHSAATNPAHPQQLSAYGGDYTTDSPPGDPAAGGTGGLPPRGLVAEVYAPSNPHGRSVWRHTPYGQQPRDDSNHMPPHLRQIGHRSVSDDENDDATPSSPVRDGIAARSRSMLLERTGSHVPSPRAMLSPARVSRGWSPVRTSVGDVASNGSISQRSRALLAERQSPPRTRSGSGGGSGFVGARQRLASSGRLASHHVSSPGRGLPAASPALPSRGRPLSPGRSVTRDARGAEAKLRPVDNAEEMPSRGRPSSPGRSVTRDARGAEAKLRPVDNVEEMPSRGRSLSPGRSVTRDARGADAEAIVSQRHYGLSPQRGSRSENISSPAVDMTDLEKMKARRKNRARGILESVHADSSGSTSTQAAAGGDLAHSTAADAPVVGFGAERPLADHSQLEATQGSTRDASPSSHSRIQFRSPGRETLLIDEPHYEMGLDNTRTASPSRQSRDHYRSPGRETRRTQTTRSRQRSEIHRAGDRKGSSSRRDPGNATASRAARRASTEEFLERLKAQSSTGRQSGPASSRQRHPGSANEHQREPTSAPDLPTRDHQRQRAAPRSAGYDRGYARNSESGASGRAGRSPVERPGSRGRAPPTLTAPAPAPAPAPAHSAGAAAAWTSSHTSASSHRTQSQHHVTRSVTSGTGGTRGLHSTGPAGDNVRSQRINLLHAARAAQQRAQ